MDLSRGHTSVQQLLTIGSRKVNMVFLFVSMPAGNLLHDKARLSKGLIHLMSYFEGSKRDTRADDRLHILTLRSILLMHGSKRALYDTRYRTSPPCMYGRYRLMATVIEEHRYTVGGRYA